MISRPMHGPAPLPDLGHSDEPLQPLTYLRTMGAHGGYPAPVRRTKSFSFGPRKLPPVNHVAGPPRMYG